MPTVAERIRGVLRNAKRPMAPIEIKEKLGDVAPATMYTALRRDMDGELKQVGKGERGRSLYVLKGSQADTGQPAKKPRTRKKTATKADAKQAVERLRKAKPKRTVQDVIALAERVVEARRTLASLEAELADLLA
jgi:hypothetical protein